MRLEGVRPDAGLSVALLLMAVLLAPETEFIAQGVSLGGEIKCLALLALFFVSRGIAFPLKVSELGLELPPLSSIAPLV